MSTSGVVLLIGLSGVLALVNIVATKLGNILLSFGANVVRANVVRARADIAANKLGIILSSSMHLLFSQKGFASDFEFLHAFLSNKKNKI